MPYHTIPHHNTYDNTPHHTITCTIPYRYYFRPYHTIPHHVTSYHTLTYSIPYLYHVIPYLTRVSGPRWRGWGRGECSSHDFSSPPFPRKPDTQVIPYHTILYRATLDHTITHVVQHRTVLCDAIQYNNTTSCIPYNTMCHTTPNHSIAHHIYTVHRIPYHIVPYQSHTTSCHAIPYLTTSHHIKPFISNCEVFGRFGKISGRVWSSHYITVHCNTIQYNAIKCNTIQYNTIQCNTIECNTI